MQRCNECGSLDLGKMCAERTGECLWACYECGSLWRDGEDLVGPASGDTNTYVPPPGGAALTEFVNVPIPPHERLYYPRALRAMADLVSVGYYGSVMLGMPADEAIDLLGDGEAPSEGEHWVPQEGPLRVRVGAGEVAEIDIAPPGGPLPLPGGLRPGADLSLINISLAEEAITGAQGSFEKNGRVLESVRMDFWTPETAGELDFIRYRMIRARVRRVG
ncbi:hypothetical protein [Nocardiopsis composta]|uniref:Uncharacterized protein n=1 Tax=Nocardiopsis composta TaxID=157465 RepID=A0A7W8QMV1_9ACTN|nr:hypothetical protein [Nocardiopsis composta]MBB5432351.1 hypothetical protein [Nocardiopsis composta]